jgi:receptor expression-enhancing protein 1/2/3/4
MVRFVAQIYMIAARTSRIPFYYTTKTVFLLYLALPQTQGSTYLYTNHLQPFLHTHEAQIDAALASVKRRIYTYLQDRVRLLWEHITSTMGQQQQQQQQEAADRATITNPAASGPAQLVSSLWRSYGPAIIASGTTLLRQSTAASTSATLLNMPAASPPPAPAPVPVRQDTSRSILERKRQLEAELATLTAVVDGTENAAHAGAPMTPSASASYASSRTSSGSDLRERTTVSGGLTGKFEKVEIPSDGEGVESSSGGSREEGLDRPGGARRMSWFGGWGGGGSPGKGTYERVKSE